VDQSKSTLGYAFFLIDSAILRRSKKQYCIALSTMEAEYVACSVTTQNAIWLKFPVSFENCQISIRPSDNLL
jgi:hypothetical protein